MPATTCSGAMLCYEGGVQALMHVYGGKHSDKSDYVHM